MNLRPRINHITLRVLISMTNFWLGSGGRRYSCLAPLSDLLLCSNHILVWEMLDYSFLYCLSFHIYYPSLNRYVWFVFHIDFVSIIFQLISYISTEVHK